MRRRQEDAKGLPYTMHAEDFIARSDQRRVDAAGISCASARCGVVTSSTAARPNVRDDRPVVSAPERFTFTLLVDRCDAPAHAL